MKTKRTIIAALCVCALATAVERGLAREVRSTSSSSSSSGVSVSTVNGETVVTANGQEVYRGPTRGPVSSVSRSENGVEYSAIMDGDRVLWESSPGAAGNLPSDGKAGGGGGGGGGVGSGIDHDAFMAEHQANFDKMVREMQQRAGSNGGLRSSGSQSGTTRSGSRSMSGGSARSSAGGSASAGGSSGGFSRSSGSSSGIGRASGGGTSNASGNGSSTGGGSRAGLGTDPSFLPPSPAEGQSLRGATPRPVAPSARPAPRKPTQTTPAPEEAAVTFKVVDGSSVVVFRGREYSVGPTHERLTGKSWIADGKEYAIAQEGDRVIWENVPGAARSILSSVRGPLSPQPPAPR